MAGVPAQPGVLHGAVLRHVGLDAQDGLDPLLFALTIEVDNAVHDAVVRDGHGGLPESLGPGHQGGDAGRSVQRGVLGVHVQVHEGNGHDIPPRDDRDSIAYFLA